MVKPTDLGATTSHWRLSIRAVLTGPKICIIWRSSADGANALLLFLFLIWLFVGRSNVVPHEYPNNLLKAASTTALTGDAESDVGGLSCGRSFRFPNNGGVADEIVAFATIVAPVAVDIPSVVLWFIVVLRRFGLGSSL